MLSPSGIPVKVKTLGHGTILRAGCWDRFLCRMMSAEPLNVLKATNDPGVRVTSESCYEGLCVG